jgi:hypothetical protein
VHTIPENATIVSVSGGGTWVHPAGCAANVASFASTDAAYTLSTTSGATTVTITISPSGTQVIAEFLEYSFTLGSAVFDACAIRTGSSETNSVGATLTLTGTNDVIVQTGAFGGSASACGTQGGTNNNPNDFPSGDAVCGFINTITTTANTYTSTTGNFVGTAIAFNEVAGGVVCKNYIALLGAGCK